MYFMHQIPHVPKVRTTGILHSFGSSVVQVGGAIANFSSQTVTVTIQYVDWTDGTNPMIFDTSTVTIPINQGARFMAPISNSITDYEVRFTIDGEDKKVVINTCGQSDDGVPIVGQIILNKELSGV